MSENNNQGQQTQQTQQETAAAKKAEAAAKKAEAAAAKAAAAAAAKADVEPVIAVHKINRKILPGLCFVPSSAAEAAKLAALGATREATQEELAFFEKTNRAQSEDPLG